MRNREFIGLVGLAVYSFCLQFYSICSSCRRQISLSIVINPGVSFTRFLAIQIYCNDLPLRPIDGCHRISYLHFLLVFDLESVAHQEDAVASFLRF